MKFSKTEFIEINFDEELLAKSISVGDGTIPGKRELKILGF